MTGGIRARAVLVGLVLSGLAGCGGDDEPAGPEAVPWEVAERILAARQGEYTVRVTGIAPGGDEVLMRSETHRYDLDVPYKEITVDAAGDPLTIVYSRDRSFMRSAQWETACGTPWIETTTVEAPRTPAERAGDVEPVDALEAAVDEPRRIRTSDEGSIYEVTLAGTAGLPPFPELPAVGAALADDERVATVTVPAGAGLLEIALEIDLAEVEEELSAEPGSGLSVEMTLATDVEPIDTTLPADAADSACASRSE